MRKILFVCTGNTCRSPMAEALFNKKVSEDDKLKNLYVAESVGVFVNLGDKNISPNASAVLKKVYNICEFMHIPTQITQDFVEKADLILCMDEFKAMMIRQKYLPQNPEKVFSLRKYVGLDGEVADPFGGDFEVYKACANEIDSLIDLLLKKEMQKHIDK